MGFGRFTENTYEAYTHPQELAGSVEKFFFELFQKGTMLIL